MYNQAIVDAINTPATWQDVATLAVFWLGLIALIVGWRYTRRK